jgi:tetratricopeptide (TPR) repeat protein
MMMMVEAKLDVKPRLAAIRENLKRALDLKKDYADALYYRGISWKLEGQDDKALQDFDRALGMNPRLNEAASEARVLRMRKDKKGSGMFGRKS